jgi:hypothetical protein
MFVLVNHRAPRGTPVCAACSRPLERGYLHDRSTDNCYCGVECHRAASGINQSLAEGDSFNPVAYVAVLSNHRCRGCAVGQHVARIGQLIGLLSRVELSRANVTNTFYASQRCSIWRQSAALLKVGGRATNTVRYIIDHSSEQIVSAGKAD